MTEPVEKLPYPVGGAGVFDVDPDQSGVSQDPDTVVASDTEALPEDLEV
ncbi:hypothetical protein ACFCV8_22255 [Streptomyces sp. NPDC056347]